ncbi:hypothetical protein D9M68_965040 [compost metagenome]
MRGIEQAHHQIVRQGVGQELIPHVPACLDGSVDGVALIGREGLGSRKAAICVSQHRSIPNNAQPSAVRAGFGLSCQAGLLTSDQPAASPSQIT